MSKFIGELTQRLPEQILSKSVTKTFVAKANIPQDWEKRTNKRAHFITEELDIQPGNRVLEMGYGLISFLQFLEQTCGVRSVSLVPDERTLYGYISKGLPSYIRDFTVVRPFDFGRFDAVIGAIPLKKFCSPSGNMDIRLFGRFVRNAHDILREGGRLYFQTMGIPRSMSKDDLNAQLVLDAARDEAGCSLTYGYDAIVEAFSPHFRLVSFMKNSEPYLETTLVRGSSTLRMLKAKSSLVLKLIINRQWSQIIPALSQSPIQLCMDRGYIEHMSFIFEKAK